ncbi:hypothetical protein LBMAG34_0260 [Candidatus Saccharibacteria bacterium]|nr:hypothetical protein LBMAG34_0260 [Candidatus Saccharibacteria bacterium]
MKTPPAPKGYNTINPFVFTKGAQKFIEFVKEVFGAVEREDAFTLDTDGLILHSELELGNSVLMCVDTKPDWPTTPAFIQVYVDDVEKTLATGESLGSTIVTRPTDFYGDTFSRMLDPFGNLWWIYQHNEVEVERSAERPDADQSAEWDASSDSLNYIHDTIMQVMPTLGK